jgi:hypothetical protein
MEQTRFWWNTYLWQGSLSWSKLDSGGIPTYGKVAYHGANSILVEYLWQGSLSWSKLDSGGIPTYGKVAYHGANSILL